MASLLLLVFILRLVTYLITTVSATALAELLWALYNKFPTPTSNAVQEQTRLRGEVLRLKKEMSGVSAQDEFSKWAKIRRQHDKAVAEYDKSAEALSASKSSFDKSVSACRLVTTRVVPLVFQFWNRKAPLFWLPHGWFPGYIEWFLALPGAPTGSVGMQIWGMACSSMIQLVGEAGMACYALAAGTTASTGSGKRPMQAHEAGKETPASGSSTPKKEL